jgi:hypothetical protein
MQAWLLLATVVALRSEVGQQVEICSSVLKYACLLVTDVAISLPGGLAVENSEALNPGLTVAPGGPAVIQVNYNVWNDKTSPLANSQVILRLHNAVTSFHDMECWEQDVPPVGAPGERGSIEWALTVPVHKGVYTVSIFPEIKMNCAMALENGYADDALDIGTLTVLLGSGGVATFAPSFEPTEAATEVLFVAAPSGIPTTSPTEEPIGKEQGDAAHPSSKDTDEEMHSSLAVAVAISSVLFLFVCMVSVAVWLFRSRAGASASDSEEEKGSNACAGTPCAGNSQEDDDGNYEEGGHRGREEREETMFAISERHTHQIEMLHQLNKQGVLSDGEFSQKLTSIVGTMGSPQREDGWMPSSPISPAHSTSERAEELQHEWANGTCAGYGRSSVPHGANFS